MGDHDPLLNPSQTDSGTYNPLVGDAAAPHPIRGLTQLRSELELMTHPDKVVTEYIVGIKRRRSLEPNFTTSLMSVSQQSRSCKVAGWSSGSNLVSLMVALTLMGCTFGGAKEPVPIEQKADRIVVVKSAHTMTLMANDQVLKTYRVALGRGSSGPKEQEGDNKTPEGKYVIDQKNAKSRFHLALHISYPSAADRKHAHDRGVDPGGAIMIHGLENGLGWLGSLQRDVDWTEGCIAVTNSEIEEIWSLVPVGTPIEIKP